MNEGEKFVDQYISRSEDFARPILNHIRKIVHKVCPEVVETKKWSFPHFMYKGDMLCSMAAFKEHCAFGFWKASLMKQSASLLNPKGKTAMGHLGKITKLNDLPPDNKLVAAIKEAMKLNEAGAKAVRERKAKPPVETPDFFLRELKKNPPADKVFRSFSPSHKREYVEWILEAKTEATRDKRIKVAIEWISEGKSRNWKYERKK